MWLSDLEQDYFKPCLAKAMKIHYVYSGEPFQFSVKDEFIPKDGSLRFFLIHPLSWLVIPPETAVFAGVAPVLKNDHQFIVGLKAENDHGKKEAGVCIHVICDLAVFNRLKIKLSLNDRPNKKEKVVFQVYELLEYIFNYYEHSISHQEFQRFLQEQAEKSHLPVEGILAYEAFKEIVCKLNPDVEKKLKEALGSDDFLLHAELSESEFRNLFREGAQPQGAIPIPVWNYLAMAEYVMFSPVLSVLKSAAHHVVEIKHENQQHLLEDTADYSSYPFPHP
jgi:hypothetical protein